MTKIIITPMSWFTLSLNKEEKTFDIKVQDENGDIYIISINKYKHLKQFYELDEKLLIEAKKYLK